MRLSHKDFDSLQRALLALHECCSIAAFKQALPEILLELIPADCFFLLEYEFSPKMDRVRLVGMIDPERRITPDMAAFTERVMFDHPFMKYFERTGDPSAIRMSDFQNLHQFRNTVIYQHFYKALGADRQLATALRYVGPPRFAGVHFGRRRDFTERDRLMLNLARPHIELAHRNAGQATALNQPPAIYGLTAREMEVARWLAAGKTNLEIAIILQSNTRTVEKHVEKILEKLHVENRTAAAVLIATAANNGASVS